MTSSSISSPNQETSVGRSLVFFDSNGEPAERAMVVAYDMESQSHTVELEETGEERIVHLSEHQYEWIVAENKNDGDIKAVDKEQEVRLIRVARLDAVGRRVKVFSTQCGRYFDGTIIGFDEKTRKHTICFDKGHVIKDLKLKMRTWMYIDLIGSRPPLSDKMLIATSRYAGVQRTSETSWDAFKGSARGTFIGSFRSEKDAALAHDYYARQVTGGRVNFPDESITEREVRKRTLSLKDDVCLKAQKEDDQETVHGESDSKNGTEACDVIPSESNSDNSTPKRKIELQDDQAGLALAQDRTDGKYPVGTRFFKEFIPHGTFEGRIKSFDGEFYTVGYKDGDQEELEKSEIDALISTQQQKIKTKQNQVTPPSECLDGKYSIGTRFIKKSKSPANLECEITGFDGGFYTIRYENGDREQLRESEVEESLSMQPQINVSVKQDNKNDGFPNESLTNDQSNEQSGRAAERTNMRSSSKSQYKGVSRKSGNWAAHCGKVAVIKGMGLTHSTLYLGIFSDEKRAALEYDRICRKYGGDEKALNFPRNEPLDGVRLFDDQCYCCFKENPADALATPCNHVFCRDCVSKVLEVDHACPCCGTTGLSDELFRSVKLVSLGNRLGKERSVGKAQRKKDTELDVDRGKTLTPDKKRRKKGKYSIGTRFVKDFGKYGRYNGKITDFDGKYYKAYYPEDGDEEEMSENSLDRWIEKGIGADRASSDQGCSSNKDESLQNEARSALVESRQSD